MSGIIIGQNCYIKSEEKMDIFRKIEKKFDSTADLDLSNVKLTKEKIEALLEIHKIRFEPAIKLTEGKKFFTTDIKIEQNRNTKFKITYYNNTKLFVETADYVKIVNGDKVPDGEYLTGLTMMGPPPSFRKLMDPMDEFLNFGTGVGGFDRMDFCELAGKIAYNCGSKIVRDDLGCDEIEFLPEELLRYVR